MNISQAISYLHPDASPLHDFRVVFEADGTQRIEHWGIDAEQPTKKQLQAAWKAVEATAYRNKRAAEYPPISDQLDALYHAGVFPPEMAERIAAIKTKYPKPT